MTALCCAHAMTALPRQEVRHGKNVPHVFCREGSRDSYAGKEVWDAVYATACEKLQDAMDIAYLTGQRPADVRKMMITDIRDNALRVRQGKTKKFLRIESFKAKKHKNFSERKRGISIMHPDETSFFLYAKRTLFASPAEG